jgi:hypothetical protein
MSKGSLSKVIEVYSLIEPILHGALEELNISCSVLSLEEKKIHFSVKMKGSINDSLMFRLSSKKDKFIFDVLNRCASFKKAILEKSIPHTVGYTTVKKETTVKGITTVENIRIPTSLKLSFDSPDDVLQFSDQIRLSVWDIVQTIPTDYSCCSRYEECSSARRCISAFKDETIGCSYLRTLKRGRVFYGVNRNID